MCEVNHTGHGQATDPIVCPQGTALDDYRSTQNPGQTGLYFFEKGEEGYVQLGTGRGKSSYGSDSWGLLASTYSALQYFSKFQGLLS